MTHDGPIDSLPVPRDDGTVSESAWLSLYQVLVKDAEDLHTVCDRDGNCLFVNLASEVIYGISPEECLGRSLFEYIHPDDLERTRSHFEAWVRRRSVRPVRFENRQVSRDGSVRDMAWTIYPRVDASDQVVGFASTGRDVTAQRRIERALRESEALHRALLDGMLDPAIAIDDSGTIQRVSRSVKTMLGYRPSELLGKNISMLMPEPHHSEHDGHLERFRLTGKTTVLGTTREFQVIRKDGEILDVELSISRVDATVRGRPMFIGCFRDVTERKRARQAEESMLRALAAIGESSAILAHEIKNPITSINLALRAVAHKLGEDEQEILQDLAGRMKRLEQQMKQTLAFAKPLELRCSACDASEVLDDVVHSLSPVVDSSGIRVAVQVDPETPSFQADAGRLEEVVTNLLINAIEMLEAGGRVELSARADDGYGIVLEVEDDGPGVAPSVRETLFKPFVTTKKEGTGLGLPICRRIIEEHGGTLEVVTGPRLGGACFRIHLPAVSEPS